MEILIHGANVLYLVSYVMRDILWLRIFTVTAAILLVSFFYLQPEPLLSAVVWNIVFVVLNVFWIARLIWERRPIALTREQQILCELVFHTIKPREMLAMLKIAEWQDATAGECFQRKGAAMDRLMVIYSGKARLETDGKIVGDLKPGQFIGSVSYVTADPSPANVTAIEPTRYVCWPHAKLKPFLDKNRELADALNVMLGVDLATRLRETWNG